VGMTRWIHTLQGRKMSKESDDHSTMYRLTDELDGIADSLGVPRLSAFFDDTELKQESLQEHIQRLSSLSKEGNSAR